MLKGLALRQSLLLANILLIFLIAAALIVALSEYLSPPADVGLVSDPRISTLQDATFATVRDRDGYGLIISNGLFGAAARDAPPPRPVRPTPPVVPQEETIETKLPLRLRGTAVSGVNDPLGAAVIEIKEGGTRTKVFFLGHEVITNVVLIEIRNKEVILDNKRNKRLETLSLNRSEAGAKPRPVARVAGPQRGPRTSGLSRPQTINLNRADITKKLEDEYARIASTLDIKVVNDEQGRPQGVTTDDIESIGVAEELGFKNGDILTSINNEPVNSREKGAEIVNKYRNASIFRIGILRDGKPIYINYRVR